MEKRVCSLRGIQERIVNAQGGEKRDYRRCFNSESMVDQLDDEIEEHTRHRDFYFAILANETESAERARILSNILLHTEIVHTLWDIFDRHGDCPCGMCSIRGPRGSLKAHSLEGMS